MSSIEIVVRCKKSRNFPRAGPNRGYWLEAVVDDRACATSAVFGTITPEWANEDGLTWTLPKARLQAIKARSPLGKLRLDCLAGERHHNKIRSASRMVIGSVFLDVLSARPKKETRWYPLLNCRLPTSPDLCIEFERRVVSQEPDDEPEPREVTDPQDADADAEMVSMVGNGEDDFVLEVTPQGGLGSRATPPILSFVWLGREYPLRPSAKLALKSSVAELCQFFEQLVPQQLLVQRNSREEPGTAEVNLRSLAQKVKDGRGEASVEVPVALPDGKTLPLVVELYRGTPSDPDRANPTHQSQGDSPSPVVHEVLGLALNVRNIEALAAPEPGTTPGEYVLSVYCPGQPRLRFTPAFTVSAARTRIKIEEDLRFELPGLQPSDIMAWLAQNHLQVELLLTSPGGEGGFKTVGRGNFDATVLLTQNELQKAGTIDIMTLSDDGATTSGRWGSVAVGLRWEMIPWEGAVPASISLPGAPVEPEDQPTHVFNIGVDLRSLQDIKETGGQVFLKYSYPHVFGTSKPFHTHMVDPRKAETLVPHSYALHEMVARRTALLTGLRSHPLMVELWRRSQYDNDLCLGLAAVPMSVLANAPTAVSAASAPSGIATTTQKAETVVDIVAPGSGSETIGKLRIALTMDDFGEVADDTTVENSSKHGPHPGAARPVKPTDIDSEYGEPSGDDGSGVEDGGMEYEVAWQLEMWKRNEEARWQAELRKRESQRMDALEAAWRAKEIEREAAVNKAVAAHRQAESKLNQLLFDCEQRDQALQLRESRVDKDKEDAQREADRKITEMEDTCRRVREEYVHQCALENARLQDITAENARLRERLSESEEQFRVLEADFTQYKHVARGTPEMELRDQVKALTLRVRELDERLRQSESDKKQYKEQLLRSLQEIAKMKHAREIEVDKRLRTEQLKVEQLKMQILTQEERKNLDMERTALGDIRRELADVQRTEAERAASGYRPPPSMMPGRQTAPVTTATLNVGRPDAYHPDSAERQRLVAQRASLLATNVYQPSDPLIRQIDAAIAQTV